MEKNPEDSNGESKEQGRKKLILLLPLAETRRNTKSAQRKKTEESAEILKNSW